MKRFLELLCGNSFSEKLLHRKLPSRFPRPKKEGGGFSQSAAWILAATNLALSAMPAPAQDPLSFTPRSPQAYHATNLLRTTGGAGTGAVSFAVQSGPAQIIALDRLNGAPLASNRLVMLAGTGTVVVVATKAADDLYDEESATGVVAAAKADQTIAFDAVDDPWVTDTVELAATAASGLEVNFTVASGPATLADGTNLSFTGAGSVSVVAAQAGDDNWNAAPAVTNTFSCWSLALSSVAAHQMDDGSGRVEIDYTLGIQPTSKVATVAITFSTNDGMSWTDMGGGTLAGDVGAVVAAGNRSAVWDSAQELPADAFIHNARVRLIATADGQTITNQSDGFLIDLDGRQGGLTVRGWIGAATTRDPLVTADIGLAGTTSSQALTDGWFTLTNVALVNGNLLTVSNAGYICHSEQIRVPAGAREVLLSPTYLPTRPSGKRLDGGKPYVTKVAPDYPGIFLNIPGQPNIFTASVDWNGQTPDRVEFRANDTLVKSRPRSITQFECVIDMGDFKGVFNYHTNRVEVWAFAHDPVTLAPSSNSFTLYPSVIPVPGWLSDILSLWPVLGSHGTISVIFQIPHDPVVVLADLPVMGQFGFNLGVPIGIEYESTTGGWVFSVGVDPAVGYGRNLASSYQKQLIKPGLHLGRVIVDLLIHGRAEGVATLERGIVCETLGIDAGLNVTLMIANLGVKSLAPGIGLMASALPSWLTKPLEVLSINIYAIPGVQGNWTWKCAPPPTFENFDFTAKLGLQAAYEPDLWGAKCFLYVGGEGGVTLGFPPIAFKYMRIRSFLGARVTVWNWLNFGGEWVWLDKKIPSGAKAGTPPFILLPGAHNGELQAVNRDYLRHGGERFVAGDVPALARRGAEAIPLDAFRAIGQLPVPGAKNAAATRPAKSQASLCIVSNVFPNSVSALAGASSNLMLLYVADNGNPVDLQATDIRWTRFDGWNWSTPTSIVADTHGEFNPEVRFDGDGDAIAAWNRVGEPDFTNRDVSAMSEQMEIAWARWDHDTGLWTEPGTLATNAWLEHLPLLAGPLTNGDLLATWIENPANLLIGEAGSAQNDIVAWARWSAAGHAWSEPQVLVSNLVERNSQSFSASSNLAVYAWSTDADGEWEDGTDQEIYAKIWSNGAWSAVIRCTSNNLSDRNVRVAVSPSGTVHMVWLRESNLVSAIDFSDDAKLVRLGSTSAGFADFAMTYGPGGNLALLWHETTTNGTDAHYSVYDPASGTWSKDATLFGDSALERSFSPVWDNAGNLTVAYNIVEIAMTNKEVEVLVEAEGGVFVTNSITVSNVPTPGTASLAVVKRTLITDVAILPGDFAIEGDNHLPGDAVTLSATLRNIGDVAVTNAAVAFYNGDPADGGALITNVAWAGWLEGAATNAVLSTVWVVPEPATNLTVYAVANPNHAFTEFTENNNTQTVDIGGTDLSITLISATTETNGELLVIAQVKNNGAPGTPGSTLALRREGEEGAPPLAIAEVPALEPGRSAQVAFDLPDSTHPEGHAFYVINTDEANGISDVESENDRITFSANLWLDNDGDGLPNGWETDNELDPNDPIDADDDEDGDGASNYAEWRAGTDPNDEFSYLAVANLTAAGDGDPTPGFLLTWGSVSNRFYTISRAASLVDGVGFVPIAQHIQADPPENTFQDASVTTNDPYFFYRIEVE